MIVQAVDGKLYLNPVIWTEKAYLKFDTDSGSPEVIVKSKSFTQGRKAARELLSGFGKVVAESDMNLFAFPPTWIGLSLGVSFVVRIDCPIPIPNKSDGVVDTFTTPEEILAWELRFPRPKIDEFLSTGENRFLVCWITGCDSWDSSQYVRTAKHRVRKQLPLEYSDTVILRK